MIQIKNLEKSFGSLKVLRGIDFQAADGEIIVILGPSGMGKSTFLKCINYLERPDKGCITIDGIEVHAECCTEKQICALRSKTSMVFQNYNLFKNKNCTGKCFTSDDGCAKTHKRRGKTKSFQVFEASGSDG